MMRLNNTKGARVEGNEPSLSYKDLSYDLNHKSNQTSFNFFNSSRVDLILNYIFLV